MSFIYEPEDDSYLLASALTSEITKLLKEKPRLRCLEIGSGSGIQLETLSEAGVAVSHILGSDINFDAVQHCRALGFNCTESDLFSNIEGMYDVIIFNPPYLPSDAREDADSQLITTGGVRGSEIINDFIAQSRAYLKENGNIYLLISSLTQDINFLDYAHAVIADKKLFFELLQVVKLSRPSSL